MLGHLVIVSLAIFLTQCSRPSASALTSTPERIKGFLQASDLDVPKQLESLSPSELASTLAEIYEFRTEVEDRDDCFTDVSRDIVLKATEHQIVFDESVDFTRCYPKDPEDRDFEVTEVKGRVQLVFSTEKKDLSSFDGKAYGTIADRLTKDMDDDDFSVLINAEILVRQRIFEEKGTSEVSQRTAISHSNLDNEACSVSKRGEDLIHHECALVYAASFDDVKVIVGESQLTQDIFENSYWSIVYDSLYERDGDPYYNNSTMRFTVQNWQGGEMVYSDGKNAPVWSVARPKFLRGILRPASE